MGACDYSKIIVSDDIMKDINELSKNAVAGLDCDDIAYSGDINTISFRRCYHKKFSSMEEMYDFSEERLNDLGKGEGEIIDLGVEYYVKAYPVIRKSDIEKFKERTGSDREDIIKLLKRLDKGAKCLILDENGRYLEAFYSVEQAKKYIAYKVLQESFSKDYFLMTDSSVALCTGVGDVYEEPIPEGDNYKVIKYNRYFLFGWACE